MHWFHTIYFGMKLYMFLSVLLSIFRSLFTVHSAMVYVIQVCRQLSSRTRIPSWSCSSVQWINSWRWTDELSETCRVSCQNKFVKLVHLVGFIKKKFVTMHGHMNAKFAEIIFTNFIIDKCTCEAPGSRPRNTDWIPQSWATALWSVATSSHPCVCICTITRSHWPFMKE